MNTWLKFALIVAGAVAALFVILAVAVTLIIEPNDYRPYIVSAVEDATGRSFEVPGDLGLSLLPCCSVSVGASRLGNPPGFAEDQFASFESASLSLKLWPLLTRREVQIGTVTVDGLDVNLTRLEDGRVNWEFETAAAADAEPEASDPALAGLSVEGLALRNGRVRYRDAAAGQDYTADAVRLDTAIAMADERLTMNGTAFSATVSGSDVPGDGADISVSADSLAALLADAVEVTVEGLRADVRALESHLQISGGGTAGESLAMTGEFTLEQMSPRNLLAALSDTPYEPGDDDALTRLTARGAWTLGTSFFKVDGIDVQLDESRLTGSASLDDFDTGAARFDLVLDRLDTDRYSSAAAATAGDAGSTQAEPTVLPLAALADANLHGKLRIDAVRATGVEVQELELEIAARAGTVTTTVNGRAGNGRFALDGRGDVAGNEPQLGGNFSVDGLSPRALLQELDTDMATADPDVLAAFAGNSRWRLTPRTLTLEDMRWRLDDTTATGRFAVEDFDTLASRFDIVLDRLNVDAYLAPDDEEVAAGEAPTEIPVEAIRALNLNGRVRAGELTLLDLSLRNVTATVSAAKGVLRLDPLTAALYGGDYRGTVVLDATGSTANLNLGQELAAVQVGEMLQSFFGSDILAGSLSMQLNGRGAGNTATDLLRGLAGNASFDLTDGAYRGKDLLYEVQRARALFNKEPVPQAPENPTTPIRALNMSGTVADGVLQTNEFIAETTGLRLLGDGGINLVDLALDYQLNAQVLQAAASAARLGDLTNATIPLTIRGPLSGPRVGVDFQGLVTGAVRDAVQRKAREKLLDKLGGTREETDDKADDAAPPDGTEGAAEPSPEPSPRDLLRQGLRGLLESREQEKSADDESN